MTNIKNTKTNNVDTLTGESKAQSRIQAYSILLKDCADFLDLDRTKRGVYILGGILRSIAFEMMDGERNIKRAEKVSADPEASESSLTWWTNKVVEVSPLYYGLLDLFNSYSKVYDKAIIDYTSDNLDNFDTTIKTSDEILDSVRSGKVKTKAAEQARAGLDFALKNKG